jgi:dolichol kinase/preprotein translocase subunit SecG
MKAFLFAIIEPSLYLMTTILLVQQVAVAVLPKTCTGTSIISMLSTTNHDSVCVSTETLLLDYIRIVMYSTSLMAFMCIILLRLGIFYSTTNIHTSCSSSKRNNDNYPNIHKKDILITKVRGDQMINEMKKDEMGITMGSLLPSLTLLSLVIPSNNNNYSTNDASNHNNNTSDIGLLLHIYIALCSSIGLAFAMSCWIAIMKNKKYQQQFQIIKRKIKVNQPQQESTFGKISLQILFILYFICIAIMIQIIVQQQKQNSSSNNESSNSEYGTKYGYGNELLYLYVTTCIVFSILQSILLWMYYHNDNGDYDSYWNTDTKKIMTTTPTSTTTTTTTSTLQKVFTFGEWMVVSSFLSLLITHYMIQYWLYPQHDNNDTDIPKNDNNNLNIMNNNYDLSYMTVAYAGMIGCIIGCIIPISTILSSISSSVLVSNWKIIIGLRSCIVVMITILIINHELQQQYEKWDHPILFYHDNNNSLRNGIIQWIDNNTGRTMIAISWLIHFLMTSEGNCNPYNTLLDDNIDRDDDTTRHSTVTIFHHLHSMPRFIWLAYWIIVLICTIPISIIIAKKMISIQQQQQYNNDHNIKKKKERMTILIVVARKYFHFIALLLFGLPTYYSPSMMYLSYAIATALLIFMERLKFDYFRALSSSTLRTGIATCNDKDQPIEKRLVGQQQRQSSFISLDEFFQTFFDEKDLGAKEGGFVVTHIALIVGCAIPLWFQHHYLSMNNNSSSLPSSLIHILMPYLGIITLGAGDAVGAIYGSFYGKMRWPESKRSVEGSIAMLLSMLVSVYILFGLLGVVDYTSSKMIGSVLLILVPVVMLEAVTSQIDNFCLPLFAVILCSLIH